MKKDLVPSKLSNLYASIIDQRRFTSLSSIMWDEFSMLGQFEINGLENFILAMQQLENYQSTMHQVMNIQGEWEEDLYKGETYCIASHFFDEDNNQLIDCHNDCIEKINVKNNITGKKINSIEVLIKVASDNQNQN